VLREIVDNPAAPVAVRRLAAADLARLDGAGPIELPDVEAVASLTEAQINALLAQLLPVEAIPRSVQG
jgi:hypothetical protein